MLIEFLNIFFVPVISLAVYFRRQNKELTFNMNFVVKYVIFSVVVLIVTYMIMKALEVTIGVGALPSSPLYTIVATFVAFVLPYIYEIYKKYLDIKCEIKSK